MSKQFTPFSKRLLTVMFLLGSPAWAQDPQAPTPGQPPTATGMLPLSQSPEVPSNVSPVDERLTELEARLAKAEAKAEASNAGLTSLKKVKLSGYVQGRYEWHQDAVDGWENWKNENRFSIRHGYLGLRYEGGYGETFLQIDGNTNEGLVLKDAEATLVDPWTPFHFKLTIGQFKLPFGYEIGQSDADRELPERASVITGLFPSDRDRGLRLQASFAMLQLKVALVNGALSGIKDPTDKNYSAQNGYAPNPPKTLVGRLGADLGFLAGGFSAMWGRSLDTGKNPLSDYDYTTYKYFAQLRLGADAQARLGSLALKGEVIWARKKSLAYGEDVLANSCLDSRAFGWILTLAQNIGAFSSLAVRLDQYDPLLSGSVSSACVGKAKTGDAISNRNGDRLTRLGLAALLHLSANSKLTLSFEEPFEQSGSKKNAIATAQIQARF
jgi:hypothetical protein